MIPGMHPRLRKHEKTKELTANVQILARCDTPALFRDELPVETGFGFGRIKGTIKVAWQLGHTVSLPQQLESQAILCPHCAQANRNSLILSGVFQTTLGSAPQKSQVTSPFGPVLKRCSISRKLRHVTCASSNAMLPPVARVPFRWLLRSTYVPIIRE